MRKFKVAIWFGSATSTLILLAGGFTKFVESMSVLLFFTALLCLIIGVAGAAWSKQWQAAMTGAGVFTIVLACSFQPWFGEHAALGDDGTLDIHRHSLWELGHVH
jgi:hypothetical protein